MSDHRTRAEKLRDMANHPRSDPNEAENARRLLAESEPGYLVRLNTEIDEVLRASPRMGRRTTTNDIRSIFAVFVNGEDVTDRVEWVNVDWGR